MGDRDPTLQAFIKARAKNQIEDAKLRRSLEDLEMGRRLSKSIINSELFEDRKVAFELKREARRVEVTRRHEVRQARRLVTVLATQVEGQEGRLAGGQGEGADKMSLAKLSAAACSPRKPLWSARGASSDPLPASAARLTDAVEAADLGKEEACGTESSGLVLPTIRPRRSRSEARSESELWPGRPEAIGSVRRPRKKPEEMLATFKSGEEARRLVRDMARSCSRNCNKPDYILELERMYEQLPDLAPAIQKAREVLSARAGDAGGEEETERDKKVSLPPAPRSAGPRPVAREASFKMAATARNSAHLRLAAKVSQALMESKAKEEADGHRHLQLPPASAAAPKTPAIASARLAVDRSAKTAAMAIAKTPAAQSAHGKRCRRPVPFKFPSSNIVREMPV